MNIISNNELHYSFLFQLEFCLEKFAVYVEEIIKNTKNERT